MKYSLFKAQRGLQKALLQALALTVMSILIAMIFSSCAPKNGGDQVASSPTSCNVSGQNCNPAQYNQYVPYITPNGQIYNPQLNQVCGCANGTLPVYYGPYGMGCMQTEYFNQQYMNGLNAYTARFGYNYGYYFYMMGSYNMNNYQQYNYNSGSPLSSLPVANFLPLNGGGSMTQTAYVNNFMPNTNAAGCYNQVLSACDVRSNSGCSAGGTCVPAAAATSFGICIYNNQTQLPVYNNPGVYRNW